MGTLDQNSVLSTSDVLNLLNYSKKQFDYRQKKVKLNPLTLDQLQARNHLRIKTYNYYSYLDVMSWVEKLNSLK